MKFLLSASLFSWFSEKLCSFHCQIIEEAIKSLGLFKEKKNFFTFLIVLFFSFKSSLQSQPLWIAISIIQGVPINRKIERRPLSNYKVCIKTVQGT